MMEQADESGESCMTNALVQIVTFSICPIIVNPLARIRITAVHTHGKKRLKMPVHKRRR